MALGVIGLAMCGIGRYEFWNVVATRPQTIAEHGFLMFESVVGLALMVALVIDLVAGTRSPFVWMVVSIAALWILATGRQAVEGGSRQPRPAIGAA